jgi:hypothetical protein
MPLILKVASFIQCLEGCVLNHRTQQDRDSATGASNKRLAFMRMDLLETRQPSHPQGVPRYSSLKPSQ